MKITEIIKETTSAGAVAAVPTAIGKVQKRSMYNSDGTMKNALDVDNNLMSGKKSKKKSKTTNESKVLVESKGFNGIVYHGSNAVFKKFEQSKSRIPNDFYGGGVAYFTDNLKVAATYARSMTKNYGGEPIIYTVELNFENLFDVDDVFTGKELVDILPKDLDSFARGAGLLGLDADQYKVLGNLKVGNIKLSGDQVFKGLSKGMNTTANARQHLISKGFDGLRYNGGDNMGMAIKHNVYLAYDVNDITMKKGQRLKN